MKIPTPLIDMYLCMRQQIMLRYRYLKKEKKNEQTQESKVQTTAHR
jgi:hypothetical protein